MNKTALFALLLLAGCGGNKPPPPATITIPDPVSYMAQSVKPDGNTATPLYNTNPLMYRRFDYGHVQAEDTFMTSPTTSITTFSYSPWGPFVNENGDGGESYELKGNEVKITYTKNPFVPTAPISWVVLRTDTIPCSQGWTTYNFLERGCTAVINYPNIGPVETVISEHRLTFMERIFLAKGWGRLAWQTFRSDSTPPVDPSRCPDFGWNTDDRGETLTDCRYAVNIEAAAGTLTGQMEWHP